MNVLAIDHSVLLAVDKKCRNFALSNVLQLDIKRIVLELTAILLS